MKTYLKKLKFVKEEEFTEGKGNSTLKLVGDILPVNKIEVIKKVKETLLKDYPFSATEVAKKVKKKLPNVSKNEVFVTIKENELKSNRDYSSYVFSNKQKEDDYVIHKKLSEGTPSIYNQAAIDFLVKVLRSKDTK